jgi:hypothetical protein
VPEPTEPGTSLDRLNPDDLPHLAVFLAGYLDAGGERRFASPAEAAFTFAGDADLDDVEGLAADWEILAEAARSHELAEINLCLRERFGSAWQAASKLEIEAVEQELERALRE